MIWQPGYFACLFRLWSTLARLSELGFFASGCGSLPHQAGEAHSSGAVCNNRLLERQLTIASKVSRAADQYLSVMGMR